MAIPANYQTKGANSRERLLIENQTTFKRRIPTPGAKLSNDGTEYVGPRTTPEHYDWIRYIRPWQFAKIHTHRMAFLQQGFQTPYATDNRLMRFTSSYDCSYRNGVGHPSGKAGVGHRSMSWKFRRKVTPFFWRGDHFRWNFPPAFRVQMKWMVNEVTFCRKILQSSQ